MLTKTLIGAATAMTIALGSLAATPTPAAAHGKGGFGIYFSGPGVSFKYGYHKPRAKKVCKPVFRKVRWWDYYGHPHWKKIKVGYKCFYTYPKKRYPRAHWRYRY